MATTRSKGGRRVRRKSGTGRLLTWVLRLLVLGGAALACPAVAVMVAASMLPGLAAVVVDESEHRFIACTVGALNAAATIPFLPSVWARASLAKSPVDLLPDVQSLLVIYAAAALGWVLVVLLPPCVEQVETNLAAARCERLRRIQDKLVDEWGPDVGRRERPAGDEAPTGPSGPVSGRRGAR